MLESSIAGPVPGKSGPAEIALVDDDPGILTTVSVCLRNEGFHVTGFRDGQAAFDAFRTHQPDLAVIDLVMPRMDGMDLVRKVRENWSFPVIMLTARADEVDEVMGLRLGADDYIRKPFSQRLLTERIRVGLRRRINVRKGHILPEDVQIIRRGPLKMDPDRHAVSWNGARVALTATEFQLLAALAQHPGFVKSRDQLMDVAYEDQVYVDDRTIDSHIKRLRKKLRAIDPEFSAIETLYGIGYRYADHGTA